MLLYQVRLSLLRLINSKQDCFLPSRIQRVFSFLSRVHFGHGAQLWKTPGSRHLESSSCWPECWATTGKKKMKRSCCWFLSVSLLVTESGDALNSWDVLSGHLSAFPWWRAVNASCWGGEEPFQGWGFLETNWVEGLGSGLYSTYLKWLTAQQLFHDTFHCK